MKAKNELKILDITRQCVVYTRVSTKNKKHDLTNDMCL